MEYEYYVDEVTKELKKRKKKKEVETTKSTPAASEKLDPSISGAAKAIKKRKSVMEDMWKNW